MVMSLIKLQELTDNLPTINSIDQSVNANGVTEFNVDGTAFAFPLFYNKDVAVSRVFMSAGTGFTDHVHKKSIEIVTCYKGKMSITYNCKTVVLKEGETHSIPSNTLHDAKGITDCFFIAITIPSDEFYPKPV